MTTYETIYVGLLAVFTVWYAISLFAMFVGLFRIPRCVSRRKHILTVVIAAHNEEQHIEQCLQAVAAQDYPRESYEVIIADDRSKDRTPAIIRDFCAKHPNFSSVRIEPGEQGAIPKKTALIRAIQTARGDIIVSTDADCVQPAGWLSSINASFGERVGMVVGHTRYHRPKNVWAGIDAIDYLSHRALGVAFIGIGSAYTCTASNFAYRKEIIDAIHEDFSRLRVRPAEDNYLLNHVHKRTTYTFAIATDPGSIVTTHGAVGFRDFMHQRFRWGAYGSNIVTLGLKLFFVPALLYYCLVWIGLLSSLFSTTILISVLLSVGVKICMDFLFMLKAASLYRCRYLLTYFLPGFISNLILTIPVMIKGNFFTFTWKEKQYTTAQEIIDN